MTNYFNSDTAKIVYLNICHNPLYKVYCVAILIIYSY